ncbi:hypothetical protein, unlikely [Trypanosoma brucei brucei TREU927]|uniref:Uncharacterized protein n=1 Tax=Trypanosoma brucei brucei (strain 927/4 GUTat10.1) TaxID=185431 RepID=Q380Y4_TRYB2|nr:hypothetical protein, unlikely [Trypanosoma brucei brucei TREU927]EAN80647.1 hypothetical protein, unlikely [Trypanosoma brucei brucei TREU927]
MNKVKNEYGKTSAHNMAKREPAVAPLEHICGRRPQYHVITDVQNEVSGRVAAARRARPAQTRPKSPGGRKHPPAKTKESEGHAPSLFLPPSPFGSTAALRWQPRASGPRTASPVENCGISHPTPTLKQIPSLLCAQITHTPSTFSSAENAGRDF